jgi:DNA-binding winged helix-turn-helix (wHTH) protein/TolB-like protein/Flp pilus assembly protein TadD
MTAKHLYEFAPFRLDPAERRLLRDGEPVPITPKCFDLLVVLVENAGHLLEKDDLLARVWPGQFVEEGSLSFNVSELRKALGEGVDGRRYVETVRKKGFRFVAPVEEIRDQEARPAADELESAPGDEAGPAADAQDSRGRALPAGREAPSRRSRAARVLAALVAAGAVGLLSYALWSRREASPADRSPGTIGVIAVLPLTNATGDPDAEYLSEGISETLINNLSQLAGVKVIARSSSFKYRGDAVDPQEVAKALGVDAVLSGRILRRGEILVIRVELTDARDKTQMWGAQYEQKLSDLHAAETDIAREISQKLRVRLSPGEETQLARLETSNPQAYELLLRGRFHYAKATVKDARRAVEYFQRAIAVDPAFAPAYAALATSYSEMTDSSILDPKEFGPKAEAAARKALELDERLVEAHVTLALLQRGAWDWQAAEREYVRALELNPNHAAARSSYAFYLSLVGRHAQAVAEARHAGELDPLSPHAKGTIAFLLHFSRQYDQAIRALEETLELWPDDIGVRLLLAITYASKGRYVDAIAAYKRVIELGGDRPTVQIYLGATYAMSQDRERARAILRKLEATETYISPGELAVLYVALGENEKAFASLANAYAAHDTQLQNIGVDPFFDPLRSDPRFKDLLQRVGLPSTAPG